MDRPPVLRKHHVFIIGSPRSGTSWLYRMIAEHPDVASVKGELTLFRRYLAPVVNGFDRERSHMDSGEWRQGLPLLFTAQEFEAGIHQVIDQVYQRVLGSNPKATHIVDKHPTDCHHLPLIDRFLPEARYVHIIRDGRDVVKSMVRARKILGFGAEDLAGATREWRTSIQDARAFAPQAGSRYMEVRYEELSSDPVGSLERIFKHCGLGIERTALQRIADAYHISRKRVNSSGDVLNGPGDAEEGAPGSHLSLRQRRDLAIHAHGLLEELGYAKGSWWLTAPSDRLELLWRGFTTRCRSTWDAFGVIWFPRVNR